jgi:cadmium resistance protein CadD (predicted permease)
MKQLFIGLAFILIGIFWTLVAPRHLITYVLHLEHFNISVVFVGLGLFIIISQGWELPK